MPSESYLEESYLEESYLEESYLEEQHDLARATVRRAMRLLRRARVGGASCQGSQMDYQPIGHCHHRHPFGRVVGCDIRVHRRTGPDGDNPQHQRTHQRSP